MPKINQNMRDRLPTLYGGDPKNLFKTGGGAYSTQDAYLDILFFSKQ